MRACDKGEPFCVRGTIADRCWWRASPGRPRADPEGVLSVDPAHPGQPASCWCYLSYRQPTVAQFLLLQLFAVTALRPERLPGSRRTAGCQILAGWKPSPAPPLAFLFRYLVKFNSANPLGGEGTKSRVVDFNARTRARTSTHGRCQRRLSSGALDSCPVGDREKKKSISRCPAAALPASWCLNTCRRPGGRFAALPFARLPCAGSSVILRESRQLLLLLFSSLQIL